MLAASFKGKKRKKIEKSLQGRVKREEGSIFLCEASFSVGLDRGTIDAWGKLEEGRDKKDGELPIFPSKI